MEDTINAKKNSIKAENKEATLSLDKKPYKCSSCNASFQARKSLCIHIDSVHEGKKPYNCTICEYECSEKSRLTLHSASVHEGKKPFKCSICNYKCSQKGNLTKQ